MIFLVFFTLHDKLLTKMQFYVNIIIAKKFAKQYAKLARRRTPWRTLWTLPLPPLPPSRRSLRKRSPGSAGMPASSPRRTKHRCSWRTSSPTWTTSAWDWRKPSRTRCTLFLCVVNLLGASRKRRLFFMQQNKK